jgi:biotin carboxyl carrier protein
MALVKFTARVGEREHDLRIERRDGSFVVDVDGVEHLVDARKLEADFYSILVADRSYEVSVEASGNEYRVRHGAAVVVVSLADPSRGAREELRGARDGPEVVTSVMPGKVVRILVAEGESVRPEQGLLVVEAMKMENEIAAPRGGKIRSIEVREGQPVESGARLVVIE